MLQFDGDKKITLNTGGRHAFLATAGNVALIIRGLDGVKKNFIK